MSDNATAALRTVASTVADKCPCGSRLAHSIPYMPSRTARTFEIHSRRADGVTCVWDCDDVAPFPGPVYRVPPKVDTYIAV